MPTPVRCPAVEHPDPPLADPAALDPLLKRLADPAPVGADEEFPLGTLHGLETVYLGCNRIGADGVAALAERLADDDTVQAL